MGLTGRIIEFYKVGEKLMVAEIKPVKCSLNDNANGPTATTKWMNLRHWQELENLISEVLNEYKATTETMSGLDKFEYDKFQTKSGTLIKIGYMFTKYKKSPCIFLVPRQDEEFSDDEEESEELKDRGGKYKQRQHCSQSLVVSVSPLKVDSANSQLLSITNVSSPARIDRRLLRCLKPQIVSEATSPSVSEYFEHFKPSSLKTSSSGTNDATSISRSIRNKL